MIHKIGLFAVGLLLSAAASAEVSLQGKPPSFEIRALQAKLDKVWQFESKTYGVSLAAPEIYFSRFVLADESPEFQAWQKSWVEQSPQVWLDWMQFSGMPSQEVTPKWIHEHIDTIFPFPPTFLAFHYDGTNKIQINPDTTFLKFYQNNPYGIKEDTVGYGFYVAAHEMMHYILENKGIPGPIHHCLFVLAKPDGTSLMSNVADYLIGEGISGSLIQTVGVKGERDMMPCESLSAADRERVSQILKSGF